MTDNTRKPIETKVAAAGAAGSVTVILVWVASLLGLDVPDAVAAALTVLITVGTAYLTRNRA